MALATNRQFEFFNKFQTMFYTNIHEFEKFTYFEIKNNSFVLLNNMLKGFPHKTEELINIYSPAIKIFESPAIIIALQRRFVNNFSRPRVPQYLYYKSAKVKPESKKKAKEIKKNDVVLQIFPEEVILEIKSILMYDSKTYDYLKFSTQVQFLGKQIIGQIAYKEELKAAKTRKSKSLNL